MTHHNKEDSLSEHVVVNDELEDQRIEPPEPDREEQHALEGHIDQSSLLAKNAESEFRTQWDSIQISFVDEPRKAVEQADSLVTQVMQHIARTFSDERKNLEAQWSRGDNVSTEDLRIALQRYRTFFSRLLSV